MFFSKPANLKHSNCFGPYTTRLLSIEIPPKLLEAPERNSDSLYNYNWLHANYSFEPVTNLLKAIYAEPETYSGKELIREQIELFLDTLAEVPPPQDDEPPAWLKRIKQRLMEKRDATESVKSLAASAGKHPTHLTRWFKR